MGAVLADLLCFAPGVWKEFTDAQKEMVISWWRGPNYSFNHNENTIKDLITFFDNY